MRCWGRRMSRNIHPVGRYAFSSAGELLFDANVWISIHHPRESGGSRARVYSRALREIRRAGSSLFVDVLVLSEFVNRYARLDHYVARKRGASSDFKSFRDSALFAKTAEGIADACRRILACCARTETPFKSLDLDALLAAYEQGGSDFNDSVLAELCRAGGLKLVTHDADFGGTGITILTANKKLLP